MADKMMRISGRGLDGTAKAISTDNNGLIRTQTAEAYDNSSKSIRTIIQNSVEIEQPDAFQMTEILMSKERFDGSESKLFSRVPPRGAKGFMAMLHINDTNNTLPDGQGVNLRVNASLGYNTPTALYATTSKLKGIDYRDVIVWGTGIDISSIESSSKYQQTGVKLPLTRNLTFFLQTDDLLEGEYYDISLVVGWLT